MAVLKQRLHRKNSSGSYDIVYLENIATNVKMSDSDTTLLSTKISSMDTAIAGKQPKGSYAAANHNHNGVYQPAGSYATTAQLNEVKTSVSNGKSAVASAITDKGVSTSATASFNNMANNIRSIQIGSVPIYIGEQTVRLSESSSHVEIPNLDPNLSYIFKFIRVQDSAVSIIYVPNINNIEYNLSATDNKNQYHKYLSSFNKISSSYKYDEYAYVWVYVYIKSSTEKTIKYRIDTESRYKTQYIVSWYSLDPLL